MSQWNKAAVHHQRRRSSLRSMLPRRVRVLLLRHPAGVVRDQHQRHINTRKQHRNSPSKSRRQQKTAAAPLHHHHHRRHKTADALPPPASLLSSYMTAPLSSLSPFLGSGGVVGLSSMFSCMPAACQPTCEGSILDPSGAARGGECQYIMHAVGVCMCHVSFFALSPITHRLRLNIDLHSFIHFLFPFFFFFLCEFLNEPHNIS